MLVIDMKHAEKKDGQFCCCDTDICEDSPSELGTCVEGRCDVLFSVTVSPCTDSTSLGPCSADAENSGDYIYGHFFHFITTAQAKKVWKSSFTQSMCVCVCVRVCV